MNLLIPVAALAALAAAAALQDEGSTRPAGWNLRADGGCEAVLDGPAPEGMIAFIETDLGDTPAYVLIVGSEAWTISPGPGDALAIGFDGAPARVRPDRAWLEGGAQVILEMDDALRALAGRARSMELYVGSRRIAAVSMANMGPALRGLEACLAELARTTIPMEFVDVPYDANAMTDTNAVEAVGPNR